MRSTAVSYRQPPHDARPNGFLLIPQNLDRGQNQVFGLVWLHLTHALVNASYNLNRLEAWAADHPDHPHAQHPLLGIPDTEQDHFGVYVTAEEFHRLQQNRDAA